MGNKTNNAIVPRLRFPEFRDKGEWEGKVLEDALIFGKATTLNAGLHSLLSKSMRQVSTASSL